MDFEDYNADMEKYCQEAEDAVNETTTAGRFYGVISRTQRIWQSCKSL